MHECACVCKSRNNSSTVHVQRLLAHGPQELNREKETNPWSGTRKKFLLSSRSDCWKPQAISIVEERSATRWPFPFYVKLLSSSPGKYYFSFFFCRGCTSAGAEYSKGNEYRRRSSRERNRKAFETWVLAALDAVAFVGLSDETGDNLYRKFGISFMHLENGCPSEIRFRHSITFFSPKMTTFSHVSLNSFIARDHIFVTKSMAFSRGI